MMASLDDLAHEINVRLQKADDHRLSASLKLAEAKEACKVAGVSFKSWVAREIHGVGYREAARLAQIGGSPDPAKALSDAREKARTGMQAVRTAKVTNVSHSPVPISLPRPARGRDAIAARVRDALVALSGLPPPSEVVGFLQGTDAAITVNDHLGPAARWLGEFAELWSDYAEAAE